MLFTEINAAEKSHLLLGFSSKYTRTQNLITNFDNYFPTQYIKSLTLFFPFHWITGEEVKGHDSSGAATGEGGAEGMYGRIVTQDQLMALAAVQQSQAHPQAHSQMVQLNLESARNAAEVMVAGNSNDFLLFSSHPAAISHQASVISNASLQQQALSQNVISSTNSLSMVFQQPQPSGTSLSNCIPSTDHSPNSTTNCIMTAATSNGPLPSITSVRYRDHKLAPIQKLSVDLIKTYKHINEVSCRSGSLKFLQLFLKHFPVLLIRKSHLCLRPKLLVSTIIANLQPSVNSLPWLICWVLLKLIKSLWFWGKVDDFWLTVSTKVRRFVHCFLNKTTFSFYFACFLYNIFHLSPFQNLPIYLSCWVDLCVLWVLNRTYTL